MVRKEVGDVEELKFDGGASDVCDSGASEMSEVPAEIGSGSVGADEIAASCGDEALGEDLPAGMFAAGDTLAVGSDPDPSGIEGVLARKRREREAAIERLASEGRDRGSTVDRSFWAMVYDFEQAPTTTNRKQLAEIGIDVPASEALADDEVSAKLGHIIDGLARLHIYLLNTNHLTDRQLYERLEKEVLEEEVRDVAAAEGVQEWVDLALMEETDVYERYYEGTSGPREAIAMPSARDARLPRPPEPESARPRSRESRPASEEGGA